MAIVDEQVGFLFVIHSYYVETFGVGTSLSSAMNLGVSVCRGSRLLPCFSSFVCGIPAVVRKILFG